KRFFERLDDPSKHWKLSEADFNERKYWDDYVKAYEAALNRCSTRRAPWFIVPSNKKWFRNLAVSHVIVETLEAMDLKFPPPSINVKKLKWE
ncbi:MAG: polyphosphate kinase 2 family protein, partial [Candidatus Acidiferrales bacterium]